MRGFSVSSGFLLMMELLSLAGRFAARSVPLKGFRIPAKVFRLVCLYERENQTRKRVNRVSQPVSLRRYRQPRIGLPIGYI